MTSKELKDRLHSEGIIPTLEELQSAHPDFTETDCKALLQLLEFWVLFNEAHPAHDIAFKRWEDSWNMQ